jgi:hypothetical protein
MLNSMQVTCIAGFPAGSLAIPWLRMGKKTLYVTRSIDCGRAGPGCRRWLLLLCRRSGSQSFERSGLFSDRARRLHPYLPARLLTRGRFGSLRNLHSWDRSIAVGIALDDEVIPNTHSLRFDQALTARKRRWQFQGAGPSDRPTQAGRSMVARGHERCYGSGFRSLDI